MRLVTTIVILLALYSFNASAFNSSPFQFQQAKKNAPVNIDSLNTEILSTGWNNNLLSAYAFYLTNAQFDFDRQIDIINKLPGNFEKSYLTSLIFKRQGKFDEMFNVLLPSLKYNRDFLPFYNEIVFAAYANNSVSRLVSKFDNSSSISKKYKNYTAALIRSNRGEYSSALKLLDEILNQNRKDKYFDYTLSYVYRNLGEYVKALDAINKALNDAKNDESFAAACYLAIGSLQYLSNNLKSAEEYYNKAHYFSIRIGDKANESVSLIDLGIIEDYNGNIEKAREYYNNAIKIAGNYNNFEANALAHSELGVSYSITNNLLRAKKNYNISYALYKNIGNTLRLSLLSDNLAKLYMSQFNYRAAKDLYEEGLRYAGENKRAKVINLTGLADIFNNLSDYTKALEFYQKASKILSEINDIPLQIQLNSGLGSLYYNLGNLKDALKSYGTENSLSIKSNDVYSIAESYQKLGLVYSEFDSIALARQYLNKAIAVSSKYQQSYTQDVSMLDLISLDLSKNNFNGIADLLQKSKKLSTKYDFEYLSSVAFLLEGKLFEKRNDLPKAIESCDQSLKLAVSLDEPNIIIELYYTLAKLNEAGGNSAKAGKYYNLAVNLIDKISYSLYSKDEVQISYFDTKEDVYNTYAQFLLNSAKYKDAFEIIDRSRSRNTTQNLINLKIDNIVGNKNTADKLYDLEWILNSGLYDSHTVDSVRIIYNQFRNSLIAQYPHLKNFLEDYRHESIKSIQENLNAGENLISLYSTDNIFCAFLITKNNFKIFKMPVSKSELMNLVSKISPYFSPHNSVSKVSYNQDLFSFNAKSAYELYNIILKPVLAGIPHNEKIIFSLSPELVTLPFEFLITRYDSTMSAYSYTNKDYLINSYQVSYTPSIDLYIIAKENAAKNTDKILLVGNPFVRGGPFEYAQRRGLIDKNREFPTNMTVFPLKYSDQEVKEIGSLFHDDKILTGEEATETNFKKDAMYSRVIHLSTHSFLLNKQPVIFFSDYHDSINDGLLETNEIVQLKLNSDLVVLSSCNSGLGPIDESEGIIGMTKAFYEAGAKSVVVSLWPVNDEYTSKFMGLFYHNLVMGMNKSEALRQAKIKFIKKYSSNPYFWSAFILCGNTSNLKLESSKYYTPISIIIYLSVILILVVVLLCIKTLRKRFYL
jgi:CHAT domain-containing protein/Flp pilus assembly protein TadD